MRPTEEIRRLDESHSLMVELSEQGNAAAVLQTIASVLGQIGALDKPSNDPHYWTSVIVNLNTVADACQREEFDNEAVFGEELSDLSELSEEDWDFAEETLGEEY